MSAGAFALRDVAVETTANSGVAQSPADADDLSREVHGICGIPIDAVDRSTAVHRIEAAAAAGKPFLLSTPNLNFLINSAKDMALRESLLLSDLCPADGAPVAWLARLMGAPVMERVPGSDIFELLKVPNDSRQPMKVFLFGGAEGVAETAARTLNASSAGIRCVGWFDPGFTTLEAMSSDQVIGNINASGADFLVVSLGAQKGQAWLLRNHDRLTVPVRAHLGAVINFQAGAVRRAPERLRRWGLEWLWRIKEEPNLWRRYWHDGARLLRLLVTRALPLAIEIRWRHYKTAKANLSVDCTRVDGGVAIALMGSATRSNVGRAVGEFRDVLAMEGPVRLDMSATTAIDSRFAGLILMLHKELARRRRPLHLVRPSRQAARYLRLSGFEFLLSR